MVWTFWIVKEDVAEIPEMVHVVETYEPNPEDAKVYEHLFRNVYIKMYPKLKYLYKKIKQFTMVK